MNGDFRKGCMTKNEQPTDFECIHNKIRDCSRIKNGNRDRKKNRSLKRYESDQNETASHACTIETSEKEEEEKSDKEKLVCYKSVKKCLLRHCVPKKTLWFSQCYLCRLFLHEPFILLIIMMGRCIPPFLLNKKNVKPKMEYESENNQHAQIAHDFHTNSNQKFVISRFSKRRKWIIGIRIVSFFLIK